MSKETDEAYRATRSGGPAEAAIGAAILGAIIGALEGQANNIQA